MGSPPVEYGNLEPVGEPTQMALGEGTTACRQHWVWRPNRCLLRDLQPDVAVNLHSITLTDGQRRFLPWDMKSYSRSATQLGFRILRHHRAAEMNRDRDEDYQLMLKIHERLPSTHAFLARQISSLSELPVKPSGRDGDRRNRSILPENLGMQANGHGRKWTIEKFVEKGRQRMEAETRARHGLLPAKRQRFNGQAVIAHGLMAAADQNPLVLDESCSGPLIRSAIVNSESHLPSDPEQTLVRVSARLRAAWNAHLADSEEQFTRWWQGGRSNLEKALADRAGMEGGRMDRDDVKWALTQLSADSLWFSASCQNLFAQVVLRSIRPQLAPDDAVVFRQWYQPQAYLAGLTLPITWARAPLLRPVLSRIWLEPENRDLHAVLWRVLEFYIQMAIPRRYADRCVKRLKRQRAGAEWVAARPGETANELAELLAVRAGMVCQAPRCALTYQCQVGASAILITGVCSRHGLLNSQTIPIDQARQILNEAKK